MIIPIVFSTDDNYVLPLCVALKSLISRKNVKDEYLIYVFYSQLLEENKDILQLIVKDNAKLKFVCVNGYLPSANLYETGHYSVAMYYRFLASKILFQYDKILYLDCDIIIQKDIAELFNTDLGNYAFAAVPYLYFKGKQDINSGIMLINTKVFNENSICKKCIDYINENQFLRLPDQDALNYVCGNLENGGIKLLDVKFNFSPKYYSTPWILSDSELLKPEQISIIHYAVLEKPWKSKVYALYENWWKVVDDMPDEIKLKIYETYYDKIDQTTKENKYLKFAFGNPIQKLLFKIRRFLYKLKNKSKKKGELI